MQLYINLNIGEFLYHHTNYNNNKEIKAIFTRNIKTDTKTLIHTKITHGQSPGSV